MIVYTSQQDTDTNAKSSRLGVKECVLRELEVLAEDTIGNHYTYHWIIMHLLLGDNKLRTDAWQSAGVSCVCSRVSN